MAKQKDDPAPPRERKAPRVPKVEQPDPRSPKFQEEAREEIEKEKLDP